ncbi:MAG: EAL domain-containing protein [Lachnospiraceae bacterium]|nr:EAL domain-containing protein [Lachnospiraceae bacterium]
MSKNKDVNDNSPIMEQTLDRLARRDETPISVFILLLVFYIISSATVSITAGSQRVVMFGGNEISLYTFAGVFSSIANLCIVLMAVFCGRTGFVASVIVLLFQIPMILMGIIVRGNLTSLPGLFGNILTIIVVYVIYLNNKNVESYQKKLRDQATTDLLTGLPNGFASTELITELIRRNIPFAAVTIDINGFKSVNDTMGFDIGNRVLIEIASRWKDIADKGLSGTLDFITRINSDEFSLVIREFSSEENILKTIRLYDQALNEKIHIDAYEFVVSASFGYALFPVDADELNTLISNSIAAMKEIKRMKSSEHILHFTPELLGSRNLLILENKVRDALENDRIYFNLQPQYDITHRLRGFEALARMKDEDGTVINPVEFIPAAERAGLIDSVDLTVYKKSSMFFGSLLKESNADIVLCINVSVKHLMKSDFIEEIRGILKSSGIPAKQLEIEITESILIDSVEKAMDCLKEIREMGIQISIDDFGTGYSSLSYLNSFPSDILKIDKSFIDQMNDSESSKKYVEAIISLAHVLDYRVIAEGVEKQEQFDTLSGINCDYIQGFFWGHPLSEEDAAALVLKS